jgi:hypothetical protein
MIELQTQQTMKATEQIKRFKTDTKLLITFLGSFRILSNAFESSKHIELQNFRLV